MLGVARRAERLRTALATLGVMPADFALALGAVSQMRTRTSGNTAIPCPVCEELLVSGRHTSLRDVSHTRTFETTALDTFNYCIQHAVLSVIIPLLRVKAEVPPEGPDGKGGWEVAAFLFGRADGEHRAGSLAHYLVGLGPSRFLSRGFVDVMKPENDKVRIPSGGSFQDFFRG